MQPTVSFQMREFVVRLATSSVVAAVRLDTAGAAGGGDDEVGRGRGEGDD